MPNEDVSSRTLQNLVRVDAYNMGSHQLRKVMSSIASAPIWADFRAIFTEHVSLDDFFGDDAVVLPPPCKKSKSDPSSSSVMPVAAQGPLCVICMSCVPSHIIFPCKHVTLYSDCVEGHLTRQVGCPTCRRHITSIERVFFQ